MSKKLEDIYLVEKLKNIGLEYIERLPQRKVKYRCFKCGKIKTGFIDNLLSKKKTLYCSDCNQRSQKTTKDYIEEINDKNIPLEVIGEYKNALSPIRHRCKICGYVWNATPAHILSRRKCPICSFEKEKIKTRPINKKYTFEEASELLKKKSIKLLDLYIDDKNKTRCVCECMIDRYKYDSPLSHIINGTSCPCCAKQAIGPAPYFVNSIFSSEYYDIFKNYFNDEVLKTNMPYSEKLIKGQCPKCGREIITYPALVVTLGKVPCVCGDGISYPNKFIYSILEQKGISFVREYSPKWFGTKRRSYDYYLPNNNAIIEVNGLQHYQNTFERIGGRSIQKERENDAFKKECALKNGIKKYIEIDCSYSDVKYIKKSILSNREFLAIVSTDDIDFDKANYFAMNDSVVQNIAKDINENVNRLAICEKYHISQSAFYKYLHCAIDLKLCIYQGKMPKKVICIENGKVYDSCSSAGRELSIKSSHIKEVCNGKRKTCGGYHWEYVDSD